MLSDTAIERWKSIRDAAAADEAWQQSYQGLVDRRTSVQKEIEALIRGFLDERIDTDTLRSTFDTKTRVDWVGFGFKGMSYAMFLNKLVKYVGNERELAVQLRATITVPSSGDAGLASMRSFHGWLVSLIAQGIATRKAIQPARVPSLISAFWHIQAIEEWPVYYESARSAFERERLMEPPPDVINAYFEFRNVFRELQDRLGVDSWMLEQLCHWSDTRPSDMTALDVTAETRLDPEPQQETQAPADDVIGHAHVQWLLATLGRELGCQVWIAPNDRSKQWNGTALSSLSLDSLPRLGIGDDIARRLGYIDVLWLKGNRVYAAFEVEHTTSIYSGLLRLSDLVAAAPNLNFRLYIVAPEGRLGAVAAELRRSTFQTLELHKRCGFFSEEALLHERNSMARWASDPLVIDKLASYVEDNDVG